MAYARLPDTFTFQGAVVSAGNAAVGALARLMAWSACDGSDGFVPGAMAEMIATRKELHALEANGLIEHVVTGEFRLVGHGVNHKPDAEVFMPGDGYWIVEYLRWNLTATEGQALVERGRKAGKASALARSTQPDTQQEVERQAEHEVQPGADPAFNRQVRSGQVRSTERANPAITGETRDRSEPLGELAPTLVPETAPVVGDSPRGADENLSPVQAEAERIWAKYGPVDELKSDDAAETAAGPKTKERWPDPLVGLPLEGAVDRVLPA